MRVSCLCALATAVVVGSLWTPVAAAADHPRFGTPTIVIGEAPLAPSPDRASGSVWNLDFGAGSQVPPADPPVSIASSAAEAAAGQDAQVPVRRPVAYTYSEGYEIRAKIHKYASYTTLPLFGAQALLGMKLEDGTAPEGVRAAHSAVATTMVGLFAVNTVTGVWNMIEGRSNPSGRGRRLLHGLLMLASDAGFVATGLLAPTNDGGGNQSAHKAVAISSIAAATASYLIMFFGQ